jgi:hypothetical protein
VYSYIRGDISCDILVEAWERALQVLRRLSHFSSSAARCLNALQKLNEELVFEDRGHHRGNSLKQATSVATCWPNTMATSSHETGAPKLIQSNVVENHQSSVSNPGNSILKMQDFSWFDFLPADLLQSEHMDGSQFFNSV